MRYILFLTTLSIWLTACNADKTDDLALEKDKKGWTPVDSALTDEEDHLPDVRAEKPKADSLLSTFLPDKIYDYLGDPETQNSDQKTNTGKTITAVVRVYRKGESVIGINVSDFSQLSEDERKELFAYHFKTLNKLAKKDSKVSDISVDKTIKGKVLYSKPMHKSLMLLSIGTEILVTISSDTQIDAKKFKEIPSLINFKKLYKIKQIS